MAASRSREETYLYATPEIQAEVECEEYESRSLGERDSLTHIAKAAVRDRTRASRTRSPSPPSSPACRPPSW